MHAHHGGRGGYSLIYQKASELTILFNFQYKIGQLYMIAKHSHEQSQKGEGVEVIENRPHEVRILKHFC